MAKIKYFPVIFLIISLFGCVSTGNLNISNPDLKAIESKKTIDLKEACKEHSFFTENIENDYWPSPNETIAGQIENLVQNQVESFLKSNSEDSPVNSLSEKKLFPSKNAVFSYLKTNYDVSFLPSKSKYDNFLILKNDRQLFYITMNYSYSLYAFKISIDQLKVKEYESLTTSYSLLSLRIKSNQEGISIYVNPNIEKTRQVPYTAYKKVQKLRSVTKYRTVRTSSGSYKEPYTGTETYYENEPYTAYRSEKYLAPNPNYNPMRAAELEEKNSELREELTELSLRIQSEECDFFEISFM